MSGNSDGEGEAQGSSGNDWTMWPSLDLATGAETRALPPFPNVSMDHPGTLAWVRVGLLTESQRQVVTMEMWAAVAQLARTSVQCGAGLPRPPHKERTMQETAHLQGCQDGNRQSMVAVYRHPRMWGGYTGCKKEAHSARCGCILLES